MTYPVTLMHFTRCELLHAMLQIGHALGLLHDGVTGGPAYFEGQGDW